MADWKTAEIAKVLGDDDAPMAKRVAARLWMHAASTEFNSSGTPIAGAEFDRVMDRTAGKPTQSVDMTSAGEGISFQFVTAQPQDASDRTDKRSPKAG